MSKKNNDNFNVICELFCHLVKALEEGGYKDISRIVDCLMLIWLNITLIK